MSDYTSTFAAWAAICLTDHTLLGDDDTEEKIITLCKEAVETCPHAASVCVHPQFVKFIKEKVKEHVPSFYLNVACVINFPHGTDPIDKVLADVKKALEDGVDEIDVVINYKKVLENEAEGLKEATDLVKRVKELLKHKVLKAIIEVGELKDKERIIKTTKAVCEGNVDFVKTSTGKVPVNATPEYANWIIEGIKQHVKEFPEKKEKTGIKIAGGISDLNAASHYILLARKVLNDKACCPTHFRIGSSSLVNKLRPIIAKCPRD